MYSALVVSLLVFKEASSSNECCTPNVAMSDAFEDCQQINEASCVDEHGYCQWIDCSEVGYCADSIIESPNKKANKHNRVGCAQFIEETLCNMIGAGCIWKEGVPPKEYITKGGYYFDENGLVILGEHNVMKVQTNVLFSDKYTSFIMNTPWAFISFVSFIFTFSIICMVVTLVCGCKRFKRFTEDRLDNGQEEEVLPEQTTLLNTTHASADTVEGLAFCE